jgi:beta-glucanase (GH16 family)
MKQSFSAAAALAATFSVFANAAAPTCGNGNNCPSSTPCCSQYGQCGVGAYCLGGCDPQNSFDLASCVAAPTCKSENFKMNSLDGIMPNTQYLGDSSKANWVSSGTPVVYNDQAVLLTMAPSTVGTLLSSTHYVWYGKVSATMTTSQGAGVVTAFIMMSDVKDEIDFEFVGVDLTSAQSNYYFQGITDCEYLRSGSICTV